MSLLGALLARCDGIARLDRRPPTHLLSAAQFARTVRASVTVAPLRVRPGAPPGKDAQSIVARFINGCWYFFKIGLAVALVGAAAIGVYLYVRVDDEIRRHVESFLAERYPQLKVSVGGARLVENRGIAVYELALADPSDARGANPLLKVDELLLVCDVEISKLVCGQSDVRRVEIKHPQLSLRRGAKGRWNFQSLLPLQPCGTAIPPVIIRDGALSIHDDASPQMQPLAARDIDLVITPTAQATVVGAWPSVTIEGTLAGPQMKLVKIAGSVDGVRRKCAASLDIDGLQLGEPLLAWARPWLPAALRETRVVGVIDGIVTLGYQEQSASPLSAEATLALTEGRLEHPRLPQPITEIAGDVTLNAGQLKVDQMSGKWGQAAVALSLNRNGWASSAPLAIAARVTGAPLDQPLYRALPEFLQREWDKYQPAGVVDATLQASFEAGVWRPTATLTGRQLSFESDKYAYRLTDGDGTIAFAPADQQRPPRLGIDMHANGGGQRLHIVGEVIDPRPGAAGWVEISGRGLEIEDRMIAALAEAPRAVIASLLPSGKFDLTFWRVVRDAPGAVPRTSLRLDLTDVRINYKHFPYALREIRGAVTAEGNHWKFANLVSGRRTIYGEGALQPCPAGHELWLRFRGENVPLDDNLFFAMPAAVQQAWKQLHPRGAVNLVADVRHVTGQGAPNIGVSIKPLAEASIRPSFFPYLMEYVDGAITYTDGRVALEKLKVRHEATNIAANGEGNFPLGGGWEFKLTGLTADRVSASPDLMAALPRPLSKLIDQLRPTGGFNLSNSVLAFRQRDSVIAPLETAWDIQLDCHQTDLRCGIDLQNIHGAVRLVGTSDGQRSASAGELALESVTFQDVQFTNVRGPLWVDERECRLGKWATQRMGQGQPEQRLTGEVYGGAVAADAWVLYGAPPQYGVQAVATGVDLNRLIVERFHGQQTFQGKVDGDVILSGEGPSLLRLNGEGQLHVRDTSIYKLPMLVNMLKTLRTGDPDNTAFTHSDVTFRMQGPIIYLDQIDFLGDAVNLYGQGETGFDQHLNLVFAPSIVRRDSKFPIVGNLVRQANQQSMRVWVGGTLADPQVTTEALPGVNQMLQQIRSDFEAPTGASPGRQARVRGGVVTAPPR